MSLVCRSLSAILYVDDTDLLRINMDAEESIVEVHAAIQTLNVILLNYPVLSIPCYIFKGQTNFCLSFPPTGAEQPCWGNECRLFGHSYPLKDAFEPGQARIVKQSFSSR
jgi:hypothetical protein